MTQDAGMRKDIYPLIIGIIGSWANIDITVAELGLTEYVMFRRDRIERRGRGIMYMLNNLVRLMK